MSSMAVHMAVNEEQTHFHILHIYLHFAAKFDFQVVMPPPPSINKVMRGLSCG